MKKHLIGLSTLAILAGGCAAKMPSSSNEDIIRVDMSVNSPSYKLEADNVELDWLSQSILDKGTEFLKSGISTLALYTFKTACMEMGIDVRDATTKKIDQILSQLNQIEVELKEGFESLTKKAQQVQDTDTMNKILARINEVKSPILAEMKVLEAIAEKEDAGVDQETIDKEKAEFINAFPTNLNFYGLSNKVWHSTELLAQQFTSPNSVKTSQTLMELYDNTLGANDIWDYQSYAPRMNFVKECAFLINSMALLGKIEAANEISKYAPGDSNIEGIKTAVEQMCAAVNTVNGVFQKELQKLYTIKQNHDDPERPTMSHLKRTFDSSGYVHVTTDYTVSAYIATIGLNNVVWKNTVDDFYNDGTSHCFKTYVASTDFYSMLYSDYSFYVNNYTVDEDYNLKYYLRDLGFRIPDGKQDDFDEAIGIYKNIDVRREDRGFLRGVDYYARYNYYDWNGKLSSKDYCRVGETFWKHYDDESLYQDAINKKMIAFMNADNATLNGGVTWTIAHRDSSDTSELINHFYMGDSYNYGTTARYSIHW